MDKNIRLSREKFQDGLIRLQECFGVEKGNQTISRYWEYLHNRFTDDGFDSTVEKIIIEERFFPSIAVFIEKKQEVYIRVVKTLEEREQEDEERFSNRKMK